MRRSQYFLLLALLELAACVTWPPSIWMIPAGPELGIDEGKRRVQEVLTELGYVESMSKPEVGIIGTEWRFDRDVVDSARYRALIRVKSEAPFAVAVSVPREVHDGQGWVPRGESESRRQELVAMLTARLTPPPVPRSR